jgi:hypothetical protein
VNKNKANIVFLLLGGFSLAAGVAYFSPGNFGSAFTAAGSMMLLSTGSLYLVWRWAGGGKVLTWIAILTFVLRLVLGIFMEEALPVAGYDQPEQRAGYMFLDAWTRDTDAWKLAESGEPLWAAFQNEIVTDQYGGLLAVSALVYRTFSPDAHRPLLIVILSAWAAVLGGLVFFRGVKYRWGAGVAVPAAWILALYPESIVLGSSQMREPFLIAFSALVFWGVLEWGNSWRKSAAAMALGAAGLVLFSSRAAFPVLGMLLIWFCLERIPTIGNPGKRRLAWVALGVLGVVSIYLGWREMTRMMDWDMLQTIKNSGMLQKRLAEIGEGLLIPFITLYGVVRPILPAVVTDPDTIPLWRIVWFFRALGWYALAPLLVYGFFQTWRIKEVLERRLWICLGAFTWVWVLLSSARAGGDQTDNPRYRTILLIWMALLAGWAWYNSRTTRDPWLLRWLAVEGIFLVLSTLWYAGRNLHIGPSLPFWLVLGLIGLLSAAVLVGGWIHDSLTRKRQAI